MNRLALFDCDGTLVDSQAAICAAMGECFTAAGLPDPGAEATRRVVGLSLVEAVAMLHPAGAPALHVTLAQDYKRAFQRRRGAGLVAEPLFPGIAEAIESIGAAGWLLGVATGKSDRGLGFCLAHHGIADRFVTLQTADRHPSKPHPSMVRMAMAEAGASPETTVVIGDTSFDIGMAKAAGAAAIGVAWGYHDRVELLAEGADLVADTPADLLHLLERLA
ncbi:HAD-IA family hydrolase [Sphingomonas solaris]|uniref:HAD-IA family hydrolase n=1 Tax=Alterirhizorhabdus solaris TaxID=2529389 RepID=A0A558QSL5_9SPHN|nr:HAD-IA family hydrolase [Sphingomonas solaris]TVV70133.1 HAD-IA family hydrolase [Sphingomonas solaris]